MALQTNSPNTTTQDRKYVDSPADRARNQSSTNSPVEVVLDILSQIHVEHDEVVQVTPTEMVDGVLVRQAAAPLPHATHCVEGDFWRGLHVLQHRFQRHVGEGRPPVRGVTEGGR